MRFVILSQCCQSTLSSSLYWPVPASTCNESSISVAHSLHWLNELVLIIMIFQFQRSNRCVGCCCLRHIKVQSTEPHWRIEFRINAMNALKYQLMSDTAKHFNLDVLRTLWARIAFQILFGFVALCRRSLRTQLNLLVVFFLHQTYNRLGLYVMNARCIKVRK